MTLFNADCELSAKYEKKIGGCSLCVHGDGHDIILLLATIANQVADLGNVEVTGLLRSATAIAPLLKELEGTKQDIDLGALKRAMEARGHE